MKTILPNLQSPCSKPALMLLALALLLQPAAAATKIWDGGGGDNFWQTGFNWDANTAPVAGDRLIFRNTTRLNNTNNFTAGTSFDGISFLAPADAFSLWGNGIGLGGNITNNQVVTLQTISLDLALSATRTVDVVGGGSLAIRGVLSGAGGLTKTGGGELTLSGINTFAGPLSVLAGSVGVSSDANLGAVPGAVTPGSVVLDGGGLHVTADFTIDANRGIAVGDAGGGKGRIDTDNGDSLVYGGVIAGNGGAGGLTKGGFGDITLSGANTYTGPTAIKVGSLNLDFTAGGTADIINGASTLQLGGENSDLGDQSFAAIVMNGAAGEANTQTFNGAALSIGTSRIVANSGAGGSATLNLGALTHTSGGNVTILLPADGNITTTSPNVNGILGGFAMVSDGSIANGILAGTDYATVDGSGNISAYTGYTIHSGATIASVAGSAVNFKIDSTTTGDLVVAPPGTGIIELNTLNLDQEAGRGNPNEFSIAVGADNTLRLGAFGGISRSDDLNVADQGGDLTWVLGTSAGGANGVQDEGTLTAGGADNTPGEIVFTMNNRNQSSGSLNVEVKITDNGTAPVRVVKSGRGSMKFRGHNTYSGGTYIMQGRFQLAGTEIGTGNPDGWGTGPVYIFPGAQAFPSGIGGGNAFTNEMFLAGIGTDQENTGAIRMGNGSEFAGTINLFGDTQLGGGGASSAASGGAIISGKITGGFGLEIGSRHNVGGGQTVAILSNPDNDWTGNTRVVGRNNGTGNGRLVLGASEVIPNGFGKGNMIVGLTGITVGSATTLDLNGFNETVNGLFSEGDLPNVFVENNGAAAATLTVGDNDVSSTFGGTLRDGIGLANTLGGGGNGPLALSKIGGGALTLSGPNTYSGNTTINGGTLTVLGAGSIATSQEILVNTGAALDVAGQDGDFFPIGPVRVNGGTVVLDSIRLTANSLAMTNGALTVVADAGDDAAVITSFVTGGATNRVNISSVAGISSYPAVFTIVRYTGSIGGAGNNFGLGEVPNVATVGYVSNSVANSQLVLVLLDGPKPVTWAGTNGPNWDLNTTTNWIAFKGAVNETATVFSTADPVFFDDTGDETAVNLVGNLSPGGVVVNSAAKNYSFNGTGLLAGLGGLLKEGGSTLTLANSGASAFRGGVRVNGGTVTFASNHAISGGLNIGFGATARLGDNGDAGNLPTGGTANEGSLIFNRGAAAYTVANLVSGSGTLTKSDAGALTLSGGNTFTGPVAVEAGTLRLNNNAALGTVDGNTVVASGATLDVGGPSLGANALTVLEPITVSGAGVGGLGAIINSTTTAQQNALRFVTLAGHTTFGGTGRWDIRGAGATLNTEPAGSAYNITKVGANQVTLVGVATDTALGNIDVQAGTFAVETTSTLGNPASPLTVAAGATLQFFNNNATLIDKTLVLNGNGVANTINNASGANTISSAVTLNGAGIINAGGTSLTFDGAISGSGSLTKLGTATLILNGSASYPGNTTVSAGTLILNGLNNGGGLLTNAVGTTVVGRGTNSGPVHINGTLLPGGANVAGRFGAGSLTLDNANATFDLATNDVNSVSPVNDVVFANGGLTLQGTSTFTLNPGVVGALTNNQIITLIHYTGALTGGSNNIQLVFPASYSFRLLDPATTPNAIQVEVEKAPLIIAWRGGAVANRTAWDLGTTANWVNAADTTTPVGFSDFDGVVFGDTQNTNFVELIGTLQPGSIGANNAGVTYTLGGAGRLTGTAALDVQGGGTLIIANTGSNELTGPVNINNGTLQLGNGGAGGNLGTGAITNQFSLVFNRSGELAVNGIHGFGAISNIGSGVVIIGGANSYDGTLTVSQGTIRADSGTALGSGNAGTLVANGATLDVNGQVLNLEAVNVSGSGVGGLGAIVNTGAGQINALGNVTLDGHTTFGGPNRWDIRGGAASLNTGGLPHNLTKIGPGQFSLVGVLVDAALADIDVQGGIFAAETTTTSLGDPTRTLTLAAGATFQLFNSVTPFDKIFQLTGDGVANTINVSAGTANSLVGPITITGSAIVNVTGANALSLPGLVSGTGSLTKNSTGTLNLSGTLQYAGNTTVNDGALIVSGDASLANSPVVTVNALLDMAGLNGGPTLQRTSGQALMGNGNINGSVNLAAGAALAPGLSFGVLTVTDNVNLNGTTIMEVQSSPSTNDRLRSVNGTITYGGTLVVTNLTPITGANTYQLFEGALAGSFANIILPTQPGVTWNTANLNVNGTITAMATVNTTPIDLAFALTSNGLDISWPGDHTGWRLEGQTNSVNVGITDNWVTVSGSASTNRVIVPVDPANGTVFYRLVYP